MENNVSLLICKKFVKSINLHIVFYFYYVFVFLSTKFSMHRNLPFIVKTWWGTFQSHMLSTLGVLQIYAQENGEKCNSKHWVNYSTSQ